MLQQCHILDYATLFCSFTVMVTVYQMCDILDNATIYLSVHEFTTTCIIQENNTLNHTKLKSPALENLDQIFGAWKGFAVHETLYSSCCVRWVNEPSRKFMFKVNDKNSRTRCEIC